MVTKIPRFAFEKFPAADNRLTTQMKSVGEVMAIGRTFQESFQKALRGLEVGVDGMNEKTQDREILEKELGEPGPDRIWYVGDAFAAGWTLDEVHNITKIDKWFLVQIEEIVKIELELDKVYEERAMPRWLHWTPPRCARSSKGLSDRRLAKLLHSTDKAVREARKALGVRPVFKRVDTCAAEFATDTAYMYSTYDEECEAEPTDKKRSWCWAVARTASARASSSTTAACMPRSPCARTAMKPSWSTATPKPCPPTTTPRTACISSR